MLVYLIMLIIAIPMMIFIPVKRIGLKNLKELKKNKQEFIISCNHMSNYDPVMLDIKFFKKHYFLAKKELFKNKLTAAIMRYCGAVRVDRGNVDSSAIKEIFRLIGKKKRIAIFPQGTRTKSPVIEDGAAKEGVAMFAVRTGTPVVPMMYTNKIKPFHKTKLLIGKPIYPDITRKKDRDYVAEFANEIVEKMNALLEGDK